MPRLKYLKSWALTELHRVPRVDPARYGAAESWLSRIFEERDYLSESKVNADLPVLRLPTSDTDLFEVENSIALHSALRSLNRSQAADDRLWAWLAHGPYWEYMRKRWPIEGIENKPAYVQEHYFLADSRSLVRHGIARLWWFGQAAYMAEASEPYVLLPWILKTTDARQQIMERQFWRNPKILHPFLRRVFHWNQKGLDLYTPRERFRDLCKRINLAGGSAVLDTLGAAGIAAVVDRFAADLSAPDGPETEAG